MIRWQNNILFSQKHSSPSRETFVCQGRKSKPLCGMRQKPNRCSEFGSMTARQRYGTGQLTETQYFWPVTHGYSLEPPATSPKKQEKNYQQQDDGEAATAVIAKARAHVITAAAEEQQ